MGIRNPQNRRLKVKFSGMLLAAARRMIQRDREDQIGDANETNRLDEAYQLRWSAWGMWWGKIRRSFCPPLEICYGGPVLEVKNNAPAIPLKVSTARPRILSSRTPF